MKKLKISKLWHDPVWSKVIAAAVLVLAGIIWSYFQWFWPSIGAAASNTAKWMLNRTPTPNFLLIILSACTLVLLVFGAIILWAIIFPAAHDVGWQSYTMDKFFGIRWRWTYGSDGAVIGLYSLCPVCDYQVFPVNVSSFRVAPRIAFQCEDCGRDLGQFEGISKELENRVIRGIHKKLRTNTWPRPNQEQP